jgi:hypothetical protein
MNIEPKFLNIKLPPSNFTWRSQRISIFISIALSLYVVMPSNLLLAVCAVFIGTPLFWMISWIVFGPNQFSRYMSGRSILRFLLLVGLICGAALILAWAVPKLANLVGSST